MFLRNTLFCFWTPSPFVHIGAFKYPLLPLCLYSHFFFTYIYSKISNFILSYNHTKCYNLTIITMLKDIIYIYFSRIKNKSWRQYNVANRRGARLTAKLSLLSKVISISLLSQIHIHRHRPSKHSKIFITVVNIYIYNWIDHKMSVHLGCYNKTVLVGRLRNCLWVVEAGSQDQGGLLERAPILVQSYHLLTVSSGGRGQECPGASAMRH